MTRSRNIKLSEKEKPKREASFAGADWWEEKPAQETAAVEPEPKIEETGVTPEPLTEGSVNPLKSTSSGEENKKNADYWW